MKVHKVDMPNAMQKRQVACSAWLQPAWMRSCIIGSLVATTIAAVISVLMSATLAPYRSGTYELAAGQLVAMTAALVLLCYK
jgi:hypothetical protein